MLNRWIFLSLTGARNVRAGDRIVKKTLDQLMIKFTLAI